MKQKQILQILLVLLAIHDIMYMPLQTSIITLIGALALYGMTGELMVPVFILFISPLIVLSVKMYKTASTDGFQTKGGAEEISERVRGMQKPAPVVEGPSGVTAPHLETFEDVSANTPTVSSVSTPGSATAPPKRLFVEAGKPVQTTSSLESNPRATALVSGPDTTAVSTALVHNATQMGAATQPASAPSTTTGVAGPAQATA